VYRSRRGLAPFRCSWFRQAVWGAHWFLLPFLALSAPEHARAQSCHLADLRAAGQVQPWRIALLTSFASYRNSVYAGEYQGISAVASYAHPWVSAEVSFGGYRIVRNGLRDYGVSDLALDVRAALARFSEITLGLEVAVTLPTGDPARGLGMGHVMLMPGAFLQLESAALRLLVQVAYGRALASAGEHAHGSPGPLVNPMNRSEFEHAATLAYSFRAPLFAAARLFGAVPVATAAGSAREALGMALGASLERAQLSAELQLPLVGTPFALKTLLSAAVLF
jgi:hypothetical protein